MRQFDEQLTLIDSAQVFHWQHLEDQYVSVVDGRVMTGQDSGSFASHYFDDGRDYELLKQQCAGFPVAVRAIELLPGLRVLNQPVWEALIAFILSANNNVKRIRGLVLGLCEKFGDKYSWNGHTLYGFPEASTLSQLDPNLLKTQVTCGYRAEYLVETSKLVKAGFPIESLKEMNVETARKELMKLKGVGPKVADCVLLFGTGHTDAFPVDVWVSRLMESWFDVHGSREYMCSEARRLMGSSCGLVQQYLFHAARTGLITL
ncbi:MAG: hypothetical protein K5663_00720 [Clostridiales bacterium]|nr:hypothetical protein [Clostridiales bacterium]